MAQSALTVTPPNPTPPTNFACTGVTGPNPPNFTRQTYNDPKNWGTGTPSFPPPYFDDGTAQATMAFVANTAALASGTSAADNAGGTAGAGAGGTGVNSTAGTYPGTGAGSGSPPTTVNNVGLVPASASAAHEGAGSETVVTQTYNAAVLVPGVAASYQPTGQTPAWAAGAAGGPMRTFSDEGNYTTTPNQSHASSLSPATNPALASISPTTAVSGASGTDTITCTGTNFTRQSVVYRDGIAMPTTYVSATSLTAVVTKRATAGASTITVLTGGVVTTAGQTLTYS